VFQVKREARFIDEHNILIISCITTFFFCSRVDFAEKKTGITRNDFQELGEDNSCLKMFLVSRIIEVCGNRKSQIAIAAAPRFRWKKSPKPLTNLFSTEATDSIEAKTKNDSILLPDSNIESVVLRGDSTAIPTVTHSSCRTDE